MQPVVVLSPEVPGVLLLARHELVEELRVGGHEAAEPTPYAQLQVVKTVQREGLLVQTVLFMQIIKRSIRNVLDYH